MQFTVQFLYQLLSGHLKNLAHMTTVKILEHVNPIVVNEGEGKCKRAFSDMKEISSYARTEILAENSF